MHAVNKGQKPAALNYPNTQSKIPNIDKEISLTADPAYVCLPFLFLCCLCS